MNDIFEQMVSKYQINTESDQLNAYHEVMQEITLSALQRVGFFNKAAFYGGTCLRIFHKLPRFSEDMDFSLLDEEKDFSLEPYFDSIISEFNAFGRDIAIQKKHKQNLTQIESAFLKDNTDVYNLEFKTNKTVKIKIEVDTTPPLDFTTENKLLLLPYSFMVKCYSLPDLYAGKMHAMAFRNWKHRVKGRDWYDFGWYVRNNIKLNFNHLKTRCLQIGYTDSQDFTVDVFKDKLRQRISNTNIDFVIQDVKPFIKNTDSLEIWSIDYFLQLVDMINVKE